MALATLASPTAVQASEAEDAVRARLAYYTLVGTELGPLAAMVRNEAPYDAERAQRHADNLVLLGSYGRGHLYPEGSSNTDLPGKTRSLPEIWSNWELYQDQEAAFETGAAAVAAVAGQGLSQLQETFPQVAATCRACHQPYRASDF